MLGSGVYNQAKIELVTVDQWYNNNNNALFLALFKTPAMSANVESMNPCLLVSRARFFSCVSFKVRHANYTPKTYIGSSMLYFGCHTSQSGPNCIEKNILTKNKCVPKITKLNRIFVKQMTKSRPETLIRKLDNIAELIFTQLHGACKLTCGDFFYICFVTSYYFLHSNAKALLYKAKDYCCAL